MASLANKLKAGTGLVFEFIILSPPLWRQDVNAQMMQAG